jgi:hypothetical protein
MTAAWMRDPSNGKVWQMLGNLSAYSNAETEDEGASNFVGTTTTLHAYRTSGFKDWWVVPSGGTGNNSRVNALYTIASDGSNGWVMSSQDGVTKTIRLADSSSDRLTATYTFSGQSAAYIRFGLSPNLQDLMIRGQTGLSVITTNQNTRINVAHSSSDGTVRAFLQVAGNVANNSTASINTTAMDTLTGSNPSFTAINMRNQPQTQQVEIALTGDGPHTITLGFDDGTDAPPATDGILDSWWSQYGISEADRVATNDFDGDGVNNLLEYRLGSSPSSAASTGLPTLNTAGTNGLSTNGFTFSFPTVTNVNYQPVTVANLSSTNWSDLGPLIPGDGTVKSAHDPSATNSARKFYKIYISAP